MTDQQFSQCIEMICSNDMQGLKPVYEEYGKKIFSIALQVSRNAQTAEDITSEFFLKLKKAAFLYKNGMGHKKWLFTSARNLAVDYMRKTSREMPVSSEQDEGNVLLNVRDNTDTEESVTSEMNAQAMLLKLDEKEREIVNLKIYCELTLVQISDVLHIPIGTAAWRYRTAIKKLKKLYEEVQL